MSEKSFSWKDCNKVTIENGCKTHVYENLYDSGYCLDCFFNDILKSKLLLRNYNSERQG